MTSRGIDTEADPAAPSIGEQLRSARIARGWSVQEVAGRLRIRPALIEALERDDHAPFGAAAYARGQLRNYARLLGLDDQTLLHGFRPAAGDSRGKPLRRAPELHPGRPRLVRMGGLAIVLVLAVLGALWAGAGRGPRVPIGGPEVAQEAIQAAAPGQPSSAGQAPENRSPDVTVSPQLTEPVVTPAESTAGTSPTPPPANISSPPARQSPAQDTNDTNVELRLRSRSVSWVEITDHSGRRLLYELVSPGPERTVRGQPPLRVLLGNAPAVDVLYNGAPVTLPAGQHVVRMTLGAAPPQPDAVPSGAPASGPLPPAPVP